jgi:hypothetical protein
VSSAYVSYGETSAAPADDSVEEPRIGGRDGLLHVEQFGHEFLDHGHPGYSEGRHIAARARGFSGDVDDRVDDEANTAASLRVDDDPQISGGIGARLFAKECRQTAERE